MASRAMSLPWKLTFQKISSYHVLTSLVVAVVALVICILVFFVDSCGLLHMELLQKLKEHDQHPDSDFCIDLLYEIYRYNDSCMPYVEIIDCG